MLDLSSEYSIVNFSVGNTKAGTKMGKMQVKNLTNNELCGNEARYLWDGTDANGWKMPPALYVVRISYWNLSGKRRGKQAVVGLR